MGNQEAMVEGKTQSALECAISEMTNACSALNSIIMALESQLKPVLTDAVPIESKPKTEAASRCSQVTASISHMKKQIDQMHTRVQSILERLEV